MGDARFDPAYRRVREASDRALVLERMADEEIVAALAGAARGADPLLANVLATATLNRVSRARAVFRHMAEGAYVLDEDGLLVELNPRAERLLGWTSGEVRGRSPHDLFHRGPPDACPVLAVLRHGREVAVENEAYVNRAGNAFPVSVIAAPIHREGRRVGLVAVFRDVTERVEAERRVRESESRWRQLVEASEEGILVHDDGVILAYNPAAARMFGTEESDMRGRSALEFIALDSQARVLDAIRNGTVGPYRARGMRADGTTFELEVNGRTIMWSGSPARVVVFRDLTERLEAEADRRLRGAQLRALLEAWDGPAFCLDAQGRLLELNEIVATMFGRTREQCLGRPFAPILPPEEMDRANAAFRRALAGERVALETRLCTFDGKTHAIRMRALPVELEGQVVAVHAIGEYV